MRSQLRFRNKPTVANRALVRLLTRMVPHMDIQTALLRERLPANFARKRFLFRVNPRMTDQKSLAAESLPARFANVRFLAAMVAHVQKKTLGTQQRDAALVAHTPPPIAMMEPHVLLDTFHALSAHRTIVHLAVVERIVQFHVSPHIRIVDELFLACGTRETYTLMSAVAVPLQFLLRRIHQAGAELARKLMITCVSLQMMIQRFLVLKPFAACFARERFCRRIVDFFGVTSQLALLHECLVANATRVFPFSVRYSVLS